MATTNPLSKLTGDPKPLEREDRELSFKEKLDKAAIEARQPPEDKPENQSYVAPIIEKGTRRPLPSHSPTGIVPHAN